MTDSLQNIIAVSFDDDAHAYKGLADLREAEAQGRIDVVTAAVVERAPDGSLRVPDGQNDRAGDGLVTGSLLGTLIGVLGGPLGMLLGLGTGALLGGVYDVNKVSKSEGLLADFARAMPLGRTILVAEVIEPAIEVVNNRMDALGGTVLRRPAAEVLEELEVAEKAAKAAKKEADRVRREERRENRQEKMQERIASLKERFDRD